MKQAATADEFLGTKKKSAYGRLRLSRAKGSIDRAGGCCENKINGSRYSI